MQQDYLSTYLLVIIWESNWFIITFVATYSVTVIMVTRSTKPEYFSVAFQLNYLKILTNLPMNKFAYENSLKLNESKSLILLFGTILLSFGLAKMGHLESFPSVLKIGNYMEFNVLFPNFNFATTYLCHSFGHIE